uniref:Uncharacterized protein n=1 Tax=Vitis vinifera TaxID=29760 RepID=A5BFF4_VITVI|nr:hypothetical protein VITISV_035679 [Vitis vinifera]
MAPWWSLLDLDHFLKTLIISASFSPEHTPLIIIIVVIIMASWWPLLDLDSFFEDVDHLYLQISSLFLQDADRVSSHLLPQNPLKRMRKVYSFEGFLILVRQEVVSCSSCIFAFFHGDHGETCASDRHRRQLSQLLRSRMDSRSFLLTPQNQAFQTRHRLRSPPAVFRYRVRRIQ